MDDILAPNSPVWFIAKVFVLIGLTVYLVFAAVVIKQAQLMTDTVEAPFAKPLRAVAIIHVIFAIGVFLVALIIL